MIMNFMIQLPVMRSEVHFFWDQLKVAKMQVKDINVPILLEGTVDAVVSCCGVLLAFLRPPKYHQQAQLQQISIFRVALSSIND
jgi:hypothetical protein